jgi:hypothetical protein
MPSRLDAMTSTQFAHLLVERSLLESERVDDVVDLLGTGLEGLLHLLSGRVTSCSC